MINLNRFFALIEDDPYIGPVHISLYMSLINYWIQNEYQNPFIVDRVGLMRISKINARATYQKCLHDLHKAGSIEYIPSYNRSGKSMVYLLSL
jgi:hypothetical protein